MDLIFFQGLVTGSSGNINIEWLEKHSATASLILALVPFIGISFLWFTAVLRDWLDIQEDRFFSTVFLGSAILIVGLFFVSGAAFGAMLKTYLAAKEGMFNNTAIYLYGHSFMKEILGDYTLRIIGVYMLSIATIWRQTNLMPRLLSTIFPRVPWNSVPLSTLYGAQVSHSRISKISIRRWPTFPSPGYSN